VDSEVNALHRLIAVGIDFSDLLHNHLRHTRVPLCLHPPARMPEVMYRWRINVTTMTGSVMMVA
jgi:hypothetical protein